MKKSALIIKGYSKNPTELINDSKIVKLYVDFFSSNAGGAFTPNSEIFILEEPSIEEINELVILNSKDYIVVVLIGHGAVKDDVQVFQLKEDIFINPGQIQFSCTKQLHIIESCRNEIDIELDISKINRLIPKYKYGGFVEAPLTKKQSLEIFDNALQTSKDGTLYLFACDIGESAYNYYFLQYFIDISIYAHEYDRNKIYSALEIFSEVKTKVVNSTKGKQNSIYSGTADFPFVITII